MKLSKHLSTTSHETSVRGRYANCSNWCTQRTEEGREINCLLTFAGEWMRTRTIRLFQFATQIEIDLRRHGERERKNEAANRHREPRDRSCAMNKNSFNCDLIDVARLWFFYRKETTFREKIYLQQKLKFWNMLLAIFINSNNTKRNKSREKFFFHRN